jgi:hypothetical protein
MGMWWAWRQCQQAHPKSRNAVLGGVEVDVNVAMDEVVDGESLFGVVEELLGQFKGVLYWSADGVFVFCPVLILLGTNVFEPLETAKEVSEGSTYKCHVL